MTTSSSADASSDSSPNLSSPIPTSLGESSGKYISSEHYRQMLVRDGDRRFQEWHNKFLDYQKKFLSRT